jgi:aspartokinase-like uncharacterized kinase
MRGSARTPPPTPPQKGVADLPAATGGEGAGTSVLPPSPFRGGVGGGVAFPAAEMTVVKVGGSLLDWPELGPRLRAWLASCAGQMVLVPGGGPTTDVIRALDQQHGLGEERAHWLALRALTLNAHFLAVLLPATEVVADRAGTDAAWQAGRTPILDAHTFLLSDEGRPGALAHTWATGSDVIAVRAAALLGARRLVLLKSAAVPKAVDWEELGRRGLVDPGFAPMLQTIPGLEVVVVNLRDLAEPVGRNE